MIGYWGDLQFTASDKVIQTFKDFKRSASANWVKHDIVGRKPVSEFVAPNLQTVSFVMEFDAAMGVNPRKMMDVFVQAVEKGRIYPLVIGRERIGDGRFKILSTDEDWKVVMNRGEVMKASISVSMEEYV